MEFVNEILKENGHEVLSVTPETSVFEALKLMANKNVGSLLVLENDKLI